MELMKEQVFLDRCVGSESNQILLEGELLIPDAKPDMMVLLQTEARLPVERVEVSADRVHFAGRLHLSVLYMPKQTEKTVHVVTHSQAVEDFVFMEGADKDMWARLTAEIVNAEFRMVNDRKVSWRIVANVRVRAERSDAHPMVIHIRDVPENQLLKSPLAVNRTVGHKTERFTVSETIPLPGGKPNVRELLLVTATIANNEERLANGRLNLTGELLLTALYRGETDDSVIEFAENTVPFSGAFDISGAREDMRSDVVLQILEQQARVISDDDGEDRIIEIEVTIGAQMKVFSAETLQVLEDAYCTERLLQLNKNTLRVPHPVCHNRNSASVKEVTELPAGLPDMLQVFSVRGTAFLDDVKIIEGKVIVEGAVTTDILYVAQSDAQPLGTHRTSVPFRQVIEANGAMPHMNVMVDTSVDGATFNMLSAREAEVRFALTFNTRVIHESDIQIINDVTAAEQDESIRAAAASMTVYVAQHGDTVWNVAKRFNAPLEELLKTNDMDAGAVLGVGQKVLVVK
jgi:hypothetical protein